MKKIFGWCVLVVMTFVFSSCSMMNTSIPRYSNGEQLKENSAIFLSFTKSKRLLNKNLIIHNNETILFNIENVDTQEKLQIWKRVCTKKSFGPLVSLFTEVKEDQINGDNICGNLFVAELEHGKYKVNSINLRTYDEDKGLILTSIYYKPENELIFSLHENEILYLGNIHLISISQLLSGSIIDVIIGVKDSYKYDKSILVKEFSSLSEYKTINKTMYLPPKRFK